MYLVDYHTHSKYSFDGHENINNMCEEAIRKGLKEIAITDHYDMFRDEKYSRKLDVANLYTDIAKAKEIYADRLIVRAGIEVGQPQASPEEYKDFLSKYDLDFIIGSVHNLEDAFDVGEYEFSKIDICKVYEHYLEYLMELATYYDFDVMGHITYPMRYACEQLGIYPDMNQFKEPIEALYKILISRGKGIEVNASGFFQRMGMSMPDLDLLKLYKACGGEIITIGCDAHRLKHIGFTVKEGLEVIKAAGFNKITTFEQRKPIFKTI
nr:histidinol-phosphatase HisJ family protein [uncultured Niameybacter sp.]